MFGIIPRVLWQRRMAPDERGRIDMVMRALLIAGNGRVILVDNGAGDKYGARFQDIFALGPPTLLDSLAEAGFAPEDVTDVILTHLHFDHCGGSTYRDGERVIPRFPNAIYHVQSGQLESALSPNAREQASFLPENFEPLRASGQLKIVTGSRPFCAGIDLIVVHGHTASQQLVRVSGSEGTLVYVADLLPTTHHVRAPWIMAYDVRPLVTLEEKRTFLEEALASGWHLFFEHDPALEVASLVRTDRGIVTTAPRPLSELF